MSWMDNFTQATIIMVLGMGLVFLFVASLVVLIQVSARILGKYTVEAAPVAQMAAPVAAPVAAGGLSGAAVAAIAMALKQHADGK